MLHNRKTITIELEQWGGGPNFAADNSWQVKVNGQVTTHYAKPAEVCAQVVA